MKNIADRFSSYYHFEGRTGSHISNTLRILQQSAAKSANDGTGDDGGVGTNMVVGGLLIGLLILGWILWFALMLHSCCFKKPL